jgi:peroxisomal 2,4-dienoyl-CoA reductase
MQQSSAASAFLTTRLSHILTWRLRLDRLTQAAKELEETTGRKVIPAQGDVRHPKTLADAVAKTIEAFGRIDFVICGPSVFLSVPSAC